MMRAGAYRARYLSPPTSTTQLATYGPTRRTVSRRQVSQRGAMIRLLYDDPAMWQDEGYAARIRGMRMREAVTHWVIIRFSLCSSAAAWGVRPTPSQSQNHNLNRIGWTRLNSGLKIYYN